MATATMAGPAISSIDDRITRNTENVARARYGFRYRSSRRARCGSKAFAPSSSCRSMSAMVSLRDFLDFFLERLPSIQIGVVAVASQQRVVRAAFDDAPVVDDDDVVGVFHRGDAVRDDERRPSLPNLPQRPQDLLLGI